MDCLDPPAPERHRPRHLPWWPGNNDGDTQKAPGCIFHQGLGFLISRCSGKAASPWHVPAHSSPAAHSQWGLLLAPFCGLACCPCQEGQHVPSAGGTGHLWNKPDPLQEYLYFHLHLYFWSRRIHTPWSWGVPSNSAHSVILLHQYLPGVGGTPRLMCQHSGTTLLNTCYSQTSRKDNSATVHRDLCLRWDRTEASVLFFFLFYLVLKLL